MSHYTVGYHDNYNGLHEICEYADDAWTAIKQAKEDLSGFNSPHKAESVSYTHLTLPTSVTV